MPFSNSFAEPRLHALLEARMHIIYHTTEKDLIH